MAAAASVGAAGASAADGTARASRLDALVAAPPLRVLPVDVLRIVAAFAASVEEVVRCREDGQEVVRCAGPFLGRLVRTFSHAGPAQLSDSLLAVAVGPRGEVVVADADRNRVLLFGPDGALVRAWGSTGNGPGQFQRPHGVSVSAAGEVFVAERQNGRVQVFSAEGVFVREFGSRVGQLRCPRGLALSASGEVFVTDRGHRVCVFRASDGAFLRTFGSLGCENGQLHLPKGVAVSAAGEVFVADSANDRVCVFRGSDCGFMRAFGAFGGAEPEDSWLLRPVGVAVTAAGEVLVTSAGSRCQVFCAADGAFVRAFGEVDPGGFPAAVAAGARGEVVLAHRGRVQVYE